jgi:hypothetical protein
VILPEVFLKALAVARNLGHRVARLTTVNSDFVRQYRPERNVVERPTRLAGRGLSLIGHHEIVVPLLAAGVVERHAGSPPAPEKKKKAPRAAARSGAGSKRAPRKPPRPPRAGAKRPGAGR